MALIKTTKKKKVLFFFILFFIGYTIGIISFYWYCRGRFTKPHLTFGGYFSYFTPHVTVNYILHGLFNADTWNIWIERFEKVVTRLVAPPSLAVCIWLILFYDIKQESSENSDIKGSAAWASIAELKRGKMIYKWPHNRFEIENGSADSKKKKKLILPAIFLAQTTDAVLKLSHNAKYYNTVSRGKYIIGAPQGFNCLTIGGTGDGKGISTIAGTLFCNQHSLLVYDPKGENFNLSAHYRQKLGRVQYFNPEDVDCTCHFNPIDWIRRDYRYVITDIKNVCQIIIPENPNVKEPFWNNKGRSIIELLIAYILLYKPKNQQNMYEVANAVKNFEKDLTKAKTDRDEVEKLLRKKIEDEPDITKKRAIENQLKKVKEFAMKINGQVVMAENQPLTISSTFQNMRMIIEQDIELKKGQFTKEEKYKETLYNFASSILAQLISEAKAEQTISSCIATANDALSFYADENIAPLMQNTTFSIDDLMHSEKPMTIYLCIPNSDTDRCKTFVKLFIACLLNKITSYDSSEEPKHPLLFLLDEFPQLGYIKKVVDALKLLRQYGVSFLFVVQSLSDLQSKDAYDSDGTKMIVNNCNILDIKGVSDPETAEWVSKRLGNKTIIRKRKSTTTHKGEGSKNDSESESEQEDGRALMFADEISRLEETQIIVRRRAKSAQAKRVAYFDFMKKGDIFEGCVGRTAFNPEGPVYDASVEIKNIRDATGIIIGVQDTPPENSVTENIQGTETKPATAPSFPSSVSGPGTTTDTSSDIQFPGTNNMIQETQKPTQNETSAQGKQSPSVNENEKQNKVSDLREYIAQSSLHVSEEEAQKIIGLRQNLRKAGVHPAVIALTHPNMTKTSTSDNNEKNQSAKTLVGGRVNEIW